MIDMERFKTLKAKVDRIQSAADRAAGALAEHLKRLSEEHDCESLEEAEQLLADLEKEVAGAERDLNRAAKEFERRWAKHLKEVTDD